MAVYEVLNKSDDVVNRVKADAAFMAANYESYRLVDMPDTAEQDAKEWRDAELLRTDRMAVTPDWPNHEQWLKYRATSRASPDTDELQKPRPESPDAVPIHERQNIEV